MNIRTANIDDRTQWATLRQALWPDSLAAHLADIDAYFCQQTTDIVEVFLIERHSGQLGGFLELNVRNYAEGSRANRVPYIEGWFVTADLRGRGHGKQLIETAEQWALKNGYNELASDAELENEASIAAHKALGFTEVDRVVCFIKQLQP